MPKYKDYAMWYVPYKYQVRTPRARTINYFRAIEMVGRSNTCKFIERNKNAPKIE